MSLEDTFEMASNRQSRPFIGQHPMKNERINSLLTHPNTLTLFRIVSVPIIVVLLMMPNRFTALLAGLLFSVAAITDYFDGYLARRYGLVSNLGKVMDPVADKLLVSCSLIMLSALGGCPPGLPASSSDANWPLPDCATSSPRTAGRLRIQSGQIQNRVPDCRHHPLDVSLSGIWVLTSTPSACSFCGEHCVYSMVGRGLLFALSKVASRMNFFC
jgi:hypothetical protein